RHWQKEAMLRLGDEAFDAWLLAHAGPRVAALDDDARRAFARAVRDNVTLPEDARRFAARLLGGEMDETAVAVLQDAGADFFNEALALAASESGFASFAKAVGTRTGRSGKALYMPLRAALTGETHGPEMARIWELLGPQKTHARLARA